MGWKTGLILLTAVFWVGSTGSVFGEVAQAPPAVPVNGVPIATNSPFKDKLTFIQEFNYYGWRDD